MQNENDIDEDVSSSVNEESARDHTSGKSGSGSQRQSANTSQQQGPAGEPDDESTLWGMLAHLSSLAGFIIPFGNILGPLIIWLVKKKDDQFVDFHGKEALNFQISMSIYVLVAALSIFIIVGIILVPILVIADLVLTIIAAIQARDGEEYEYPFTIRMIS